MRRRLKGLIAGACVAVAGGVFSLTPLGSSFEQNIGLSWLFMVRGGVEAPKDVVVVAIDEQTGNQLGLAKLPREWPRSVHARVVESLARRGASVIVFDMDFQKPKQPEDDAKFARMMDDAGRVVLAEKLVGKRQPLVNSSRKQTGFVWVEQLLQPIPVLAMAAKGLGPFPLPKVQAAIHQFWTFKHSVDAPTMPTVALQIHAMSAYPYLRQLLEKAGVSAPLPLADSARAVEVINFMRQLRLVFTKNPGLGERLFDLLTNDGKLDVPGTERLKLQALIGLYQDGDHRYLNFYGPPGSITTIPYHLIANNQDSDLGMALPDLTGKAIFVGYSDLYDPGQPDHFYTVFTNDDGVDLSGVEVAATAFGNLLTNTSLRSVGILKEILIVSAFGVVAGGIAFLLPAIAGVPLLLMMAAGYAAVAQQAFTETNVWLPLAVPLLLQLPLALFGGLLSQYFLERRKKNRATQAMSLYLPEYLARDFTEKNLDQSALNRVTYSVCFASDMAGFTAIAEVLKPKELAAFLNDYFETLSDPLRRHGVDVMEFRADGIMCAWTAEQADPEVRRKALLAGLEAIDAIAGFKIRYPEFSQSLRIGIEDGMAYIGHAGGGGHFVYSIVGDCANTAARIEALNKYLRTQMLVSGSVMAGIEGFLCRFVGEFHFVGKTENLSVLEVLALAATADESQKQLCERFNKAMDEFRHRHWLEAGEAFQAILVEYPEDAPTLFYLSRCRHYAEWPPDESPWVIHMEAK